MVIRDLDGFDFIDAMLDQSITTTVLAPPAPGAGPQAIPVVSLGPVQVMARSGSTIPVVTATIRTPSAVISTTSAPSGLFQATLDQNLVDQGAVIIFSAPGYLSTTVQAVGLICNRGARNEVGQIVSMTAQNCSFPVYFLDSVQATLPQTPYPATYAPGQYGPPPGQVPYGYPQGPTYAQPPYGYPPAPQQEVRYRSSDVPVEDRPGRRTQTRRRPMKDATVPAPPTAPENQAVPAPPAPGIFALTGGVNPWILAGGGVVGVGLLIWLVKS